MIKDYQWKEFYDVEISILKHDIKILKMQLKYAIEQRRKEK